MSIKMRRLREGKNISKKGMATALEVTYRTITNWEKRNGVVPSLETALRIAKVLQVPLVEVFNSFLVDPDCEREMDSGFKFHDHTQDFLDAFPKPSKSFTLFKYLDAFSLLGEGFLIYRYRLFRFSHIVLHEKKQKDSSEEEEILHLFSPFDGCLLEDENFNCIILNIHNVISWKIVPSEQAGTAIELIVNMSLFPDMDAEISQNGNATVDLCTYKYGKITSLPYYRTDPLEFEKNIDNVLAKYIRFIRQKHNMTQQQFAKYISSSLGKRLGKQTVAQWEQGNLMPTLKAIQIICIMFDIPAEQLLAAYEYGYYINNGIDKTDRCYNLGLNHLFSLIHDYDSLAVFLRTLLFSQEILIDPGNEKAGTILYNEREHAIRHIIVKQESIVFELSDKREFRLTDDSLKAVEPCNIHMNFFFEFHLSTIEEPSITVCLF